MDYVVLDSGPLGLVSNPAATGEPAAARLWLRSLMGAGAHVVIPEIADYEVRRELIRAGKARGLARLDSLGELLDYLGLTTRAMRRAADFWAEARRGGRPTASPESLDADVILAAQVMDVAAPGDSIVVATVNVGHIARYVAAKPWREIT